EEKRMEAAGWKAGAGTGGKAAEAVSFQPLRLIVNLHRPQARRNRYPSSIRVSETGHQGIVVGDIRDRVNASAGVRAFYKNPVERMFVADSRSAAIGRAERVDQVFLRKSAEQLRARVSRSVEVAANHHT